MSLKLTWMPITPFFGKKEDKISHYQRILAELNREIDQSLASLSKYPVTSLALLEFNDHLTTQAASQFIKSPYPYVFKLTLLDINGILSNVL
jgi:hypothetical protein